jgi:PAS domain S-box-containing protein
MKKKPNLSPDAAALRRRTEERLKAAAIDGEGRKTKTDPQRLVHELKVYQIELEMQNEELRTSRAEVEAAADRYTDLYDFAPVGYFTLDRNGTITQINLNGARLLGFECARLLGRQFRAFVTEADWPAFNAFFSLAFTARDTLPFCEITLEEKDRPPRIVRIEASLSADKKECRAVTVDITERKQAEERIRRLVQHMETVREDEHKQISYDLHEDIGQLLAALKLGLSMAQGTCTDGMRRKIKDMQSLLNDCMLSIDSLCRRLRPGVLDFLGLNKTLIDLADHWQQRTGIECDIEADFPDQELPEQVKTAVFRIMEEALDNVSHHARASRVEIRLTSDSRTLHLSIADNGCGMEMAEPQKPASFGFLGMHERIEALNGKLRIKSAPDAGMKIEVTLPLHQKSGDVRRKESKHD